MYEPLVIGVTGNPGSGKSTLAEYMHKIYGFSTYEGSDVLKNIARRKGALLDSRESYSDFHRQMQRELGMSFLADLIIDHQPTNLAAHIGLRARADFDRIRSLGSRGLVVALVAPPDICLSRVDTSNPKNPKTPTEYAAALAIEASSNGYGTHTAYCIKNADYTIDTSGELLETFGQFDDIMQRVAS